MDLARTQESAGIWTENRGRTLSGCRGHIWNKINDRLGLAAPENLSLDKSVYVELLEYTTSLSFPLST